MAAAAPMILFSSAEPPPSDAADAPEAERAEPSLSDELYVCFITPPTLLRRRRHAAEPPRDAATFTSL